MRLQTSNLSIAEIRDALKRKELIVNKSYQRNSEVWSLSAKSYFIDTILTGFPFAKVYFSENIDRSTKRIRREIVDGQQRITTIIAFIENHFALSSASKKFKGKTFDELEEDEQIKFLSYSVPIDMIIGASVDDILEMFRRMNSFTSPLNKAELRHSSYQGQFKWTINELTDTYAALLVDYSILTKKQVVRMGDADLLTELFQIIISGIVNRSDATLDKLYKEYNDNFPLRDECVAKLSETLNFVVENLSGISGTFICKPYVFYSLVAALIQNKFGGVSVATGGLRKGKGHFCADPQKALDQLMLLSDAHETQEFQGRFGDYVEACVQTTHRVAQRRTRTNWLMDALNCQL